ncbi:L-2,4-diaminobutyric acid acetyltransferase [Vibrio nigripulchritudo ATCC 27043]|uniref:L-2,4-diaminobutyric acid acetyltransferase n=1 Tax=Vibrio nigripulchritudo SOn1 TaxID=1238450 RepID=A0AAV2VTC4_9VIBR|nr:diaminobutyrate acetyltransferase [Vibrio nigripulchritudo]EGU50894.1 L-2,4-diaminobutyric acid acetyltransferase [Vibrio nigripulchritudo ATCC 27043]CCO47900.1 L-2,4-diaminobutyric acid acetyltransferase [Vibrio nigripulchritudo SOn1]
MTVAAPWVAFPEILEKTKGTWIFRTPDKTDGDNIHQLIAKCPPLDTNSSYCNFLQSFHFKETCVLAEYKGDLAGFISGYRKPNSPNELFVWQVAVAPSHRGKGLAFAMLRNLLERESLKGIEYVETTITESNQASWSLFKKLDKENGDNGSKSIFLDEADHFNGKHDTEYLYRIPLLKI